MHLLWHLRTGDLCCEVTENTFNMIMNSLDAHGEEDFIQINDSRFDDSTAKLVKRSEILGFECRETALLKYTEGKL